MKKFIGIVLLLLAAELQAQQQFIITGDVSKVKESIEKVQLQYYANGTQTTDSCVVVNGKYTFKGSVSAPVMVYLIAQYKADTGSKVRKAFFGEKDIAQFFLENSKINIINKDSFSNFSVTGSKAELENKKIKATTKEITDKMKTLDKQYGALRAKNDEEGMKQLEKTYDSLDAQMRAKYKAFVMANPMSPLALFALDRFAGYAINAAEVEPVFMKLPAEKRNSVAGKEMAKKIEIAKKTGVGAMAMDFTQNDTLGNPVTLSSFRGKYVLIDFWASWCGPCRAENPTVVEVFNTYKDKGFHVLGVSLDNATGKEKWMKAIHDDKLTWTHVSDLKYWNNAVAVMYGIQAIPQNFLVDPTGKIIGKDLRGDALKQKMAEIYK